MRTFLFIAIFFLAVPAEAQRLKDGRYVFTMVSTEFKERVMGTCEVIVKGDSIRVINDGTLTGKAGELIEAGKLMKHKSGRWIIAHKPEDALAPEVGGCSDGPTVIDPKKKKVFTC